MGNRVNPRRVPRTQKDVDAAYDRGVTEGLHRGIELMLYVLIDKRSAPMDDVQQLAGVGLVVVPATRGDVLRRMSDRELAVQLFDFRFDGYAKAQGAETALPDTIHSIENWLKEEMDE